MAHDSNNDKQYKKMLNIPKDKKIILFDGVCNLCDSAVQFIIKHDTNDIFRFVAIQSDLGQEIIKHLGIDTQKTDSIILFEPGLAYYFKSEAAFEIAKKIGGLFYLTSIFSVLPTSFSNFVYDYIAKNRYKWFGKRESCIIITKELNAKFLE